MLDSISFHLPCQKAHFEEASHSPYVKVSLIALGSISFLISMLVFYRVPGMNSLGASGGWSFFGCGFATLLGGVLVRCKEKVPIENQDSQEEVRLLGNRDVTQSVEPCLLLNPFDHPNFNDELLVYLFSFFTLKTHVTAARVSQRWKHCAKEESLWERHCLRIINQPRPLEGTWREQYKKISNWMFGRFQKTSYEHPICGKSEITLLEDGTGLEIVKESYRSRYVVRNLETDARKIIDYWSINNAIVERMSIYGKTFATLDNYHNVLCINLTKDEQTQFFSTPNAKPRERSMSSAIYCNDTEVIAFYEFKFTIWNLNQPEKPRLTVDFDKEIKTLYSTPNFLIVRSLDYGLHYLSKVTGVSTELSLSLVDHTTATSGPYLAFLNTSGNLQIYKDKGNELILLHSIELFNQQIQHPTVHLFQNWVLFGNNGVLKIWNADSGIQLADIQYGIEITEFTANFDKLLTRKVTDDSYATAYTYTFYDFSPPEKKNNLNNLFAF